MSTGLLRDSLSFTLAQRSSSVSVIKTWHHTLHNHFSWDKTNKQSKPTAENAEETDIADDQLMFGCWFAGLTLKEV